MAQLTAMHKASGEMRVIEETFGMTKQFEGLTLKQREHRFLSLRKALTYDSQRGLKGPFLAWGERVQVLRHKHHSFPTRGINRPHSVGSHS